jgi:hypothetical protein
MKSGGGKVVAGLVPLLLLSLVLAVQLVGAQQQQRTAETCAQDLAVLQDAMRVFTPQGEQLSLACNMTYNPCEPGSEFRYRDPEERISNAGPVEITCGTRQLLECDANGCLTQVTLADVGLHVNGTMDAMAPFPSLKVLDIDGYCEGQTGPGGICSAEFNGTLANFVSGVNKDLEYLSMRGTFLNGDTSILTNLPNLKHLDLYGNMELEGDLNAFLGQAQSLEYLNLMSTCTAVETASVGALKDLIFLNLHAWGATPPIQGCPMVSGSLSDIADLDQLQYLDLTNWESKGQMTDFSKMTKMQALYAGNFDGSLEITGSLSDITGLQNLQTLLLSKLDISVDMDDLSNFPDLTSLTLFDVNDVSGSVSEVCALENMNRLQLTGVAGASCDDVPCLDTCGISA